MENLTKKDLGRQAFLETFLENLTKKDLGRQAFLETFLENLTKKDLGRQGIESLRVGREGGGGAFSPQIRR